MSKYLHYEPGMCTGFCAKCGVDLGPLTQEQIQNHFDLHTEEEQNKIE